MPDKAALEQLCSGSSGDIRSAINSLQFSCFTGELSLEKHLWASKKGKAPKPLPRTKGRARSAKSTEVLEESPAIGGKDASLFLFRALGKILYCKRESGLQFTHVFMLIIYCAIKDVRVIRAGYNFRRKL